MTAAGYQVQVQPFTFDRFEETAPPVFQRLTPTQQTYANGTDFQTMDYSGSGNITNARLVAAGGIVIPSPGGSTSGCTAADFTGFPAGAVALIQRGTCTFREKATNAKNAGAVGVVIFNEGNVDPDDDRLGVIFGTLDPPQFDRPVIGTTFAAGRDLYNLLQSGADVRVNLSVTAHVVPTQSANVIADTVGGRADRTVVVGAHLDSVDAGPGINDNGSGSAMLLDLAKQMSNLNITPTNKVRFAWWGGEEFGLLGAEHYVSTLPKAELKNIALNLNFDMVASPNYVRFVYDGDGSATDTKARAARARSSRRSSTTSRRRVSRPSRPRSTDAPTTGRSSTAGSPQAVSSPGPRGSRRPPRRRRTAAPPVSPTTSATTSCATSGRATST